MKFGVEDLRVPESGAEVLNCPRVEDKVRILAGGFDGHVVNPVDPAELSETIRSLVAARAA